MRYLFLDSHVICSICRHQVSAFTPEFNPHPIKGTSSIGTGSNVGWLNRDS